MTAKTDLSAERLRELLNYDPETGVFTRKVRTSNYINVGDVVGTNTHGYLCGRVNNHLYMMHHLAWLYIHGTWSKKNIDHRNGDRSDNRIANLREADHFENAQNVVAHKDGSSGYLGVSWHKQAKAWCARIYAYGKQHSLGVYQDPLEAHRVYLEAKANVHRFNPVPRDRLNAT